MAEKHISRELLRSYCGLYERREPVREFLEEDEWFRATCISCLTGMSAAIEDRITEVIKERYEDE